MMNKVVSATIFFLGMGVLHAASGVDIYTSKQITEMGGALSPHGSVSADKALGRYGNHYFLLAKREATGSSELHQHEADVFVIQSGSGALLSGGTLTQAHETKPGELRGKGIEGGEKHPIHAGDVIHIPAGIPHQVLVDEGTPFLYFVVKVTGQ